MFFKAGVPHCAFELAVAYLVLSQLCRFLRGEAAVTYFAYVFKSGDPYYAFELVGFKSAVPFLRFKATVTL